MAETKTRRVAKRIADNVTQLRPTPPERAVVTDDDVDPFEESSADLLDRAEAEDAQQAEARPRYVDHHHTLEACTARAERLSTERPQWLWAVIVRATGSSKAPKAGELVPHDVVLLPREPWLGESAAWTAWRTNAVAAFDDGRPVALARRSSDADQTAGR